MEIELAFAGAAISLKLPDNIRFDEFTPAVVDTAIDFDDFGQSLRQANAQRWLEDTKPLIIVNDAHRNTPTIQILDWLDAISPRLMSGATFLIACGTHQPPTTEQLETILGRHYTVNSDRVFIHDCDDVQNMLQVGRDSFDQQFWTNKLVLEHSHIIVISSVEPHYFAGYTGGRKSFFPGLTDRATIVRNHNLANSLDAQPARLTGNPVAEHIAQMAAQLNSDSILSIQAVLDARQKIANIYCGTLEASFNAAVSASEAIFVKITDNAYDVVLCEMKPPLDANLYQSQKALENCQQAVKKNGAAIVISACRQGIGSTHFFDLAQKWDTKENRASDGLAHFGSHKLSRVVTMNHRIEACLHSLLDHDTASRVFYKPVDDLQEFLNNKTEKNTDASVALVRDAGSTVLKVIHETH